ncbi:MAG: hypothetical protein H6934_06980 [Burkholderiaceae bacterium]|nr:hypothetical protein [Burkholderiaceae bacterium]
MIPGKAQGDWRSAQEARRGTMESIERAHRIVTAERDALEAMCRAAGLSPTDCTDDDLRVALLARAR